MRYLTEAMGFRERLAAVPWGALEGRAATVCDAIARTLAGEAAERCVERALRANRELDRDGRRAFAEAIFGVSLWRRRLAGADAGAALFTFLRDVAGLDEVAAARLAGLSGGTRSSPGLAPSFGRAAPLPAKVGRATNFAERWSFPDWIAASFERDFGPAAEALAEALASPGPIFVRANALLTDRAALLRELAAEGVATRPTRFAPDGLVLETERPNVLGLAAHRAGRFEVQDEASQLVAALVGARPGETVLDLCAGAGGKTLALAAAMRNAGRLVAHDVDGDKLARLAIRARRAGATVAVLRELPEAFVADRVLVDAPCSELGALRRGPDLRWRLREADALAFPAVQLNLLRSAAHHVRPGGRLVYATCTLRREENDDVARAFERDATVFEREAPGDGRLDSSFGAEAFLALPHVHGTDGFFAAVWRRAR